LRLCKEFGTISSYSGKIDATGGPLPGLHSFYRGGLLSTYDAETRQALLALKEKIDVAALATIWDHPPVWVHGDISVGNAATRRAVKRSLILGR